MPTRSVIDLQIVSDEGAAKLYDELVTRTSDFQSFAGKLSRFIGGLGARGAKMIVRVDTSTDGSTLVAGDGGLVTCTVTQAGLGTSDTLSIGGTTLTWGTDMAIGASDTEAATNLAAAINADSTLAGVFFATSAAGVVTIYCDAAPMVAQHVVISTNDTANMALSATTFAYDTTADSSLGASEVRKSGVA